jgi:hypothetical protein
MKVYLDFDGTVCEHAFPKIGREVPHALRVVKLLYDKGHTVILNSVRCELREDNVLKHTFVKAKEFILHHPKHEINELVWTPKKVNPLNLDLQQAINLDDNLICTIIKEKKK